MITILLISLFSMSGSPTVSDQASQAQVEAWTRIVRHLEAVRSGEGDAADVQSGKCGLGTILAYMEHRESMPSDLQRRAAAALAPPIRQKNRIIGTFSIHYDTVGRHAPALLDGAGNSLPGTTEQFVDSTGRAFMKSWSVEVDDLGYDAPPLEQDGLYHVYISSLPSNLYGQTVPDADPTFAGPPPRYGTYIEIDNDFSTVYTPSRGIQGLKVTAAHEFHHAIQLGSYGTWMNERYFYEITSTWMEEMVYDEVNDYYQYLSGDPVVSSQFSHPDVRMTEFNGSIEYSRAVWGIFLTERFSASLMRSIWNRMRLVTSIPSMEQSLGEIGSSLREAFIEYSLWNYFTGERSGLSRSYEEAASYPAIPVSRLRPEIEFRETFRSIIDSTQALSAVYRLVCIPGSPSDGCATSPKMIAVITNINTSAAAGRTIFPFAYEMSRNGDASYRHLSNGLYVRLNVQDPAQWNAWETVPAVVADVEVYPNPFIASGVSMLKFRLPPVAQQTARVQIFSISLDEVFAGDLPVVDIRPLEPGLRWNGIRTGGEPAATGVYFFVITTGDREFKGKFTLIRE